MSTRFSLLEHATARRALVPALAIVAMAAPGAGPLAAQGTSVPPPSVLTSRDALVAGMFLAGALAAAPLDRPLAVGSQRPALQQDRAARSAATLFRRAAEPGALVVLGAMWGVGRLADEGRVAEAGVRGLEAVGVALAVTGGVKMLAGRARPYVSKDHPRDFAFGRGFRGSEWRSFPSGHTTVGFAAAAAVTSTVAARSPGARWPLGGALYGAATLMGLSRIYEDRHWASDVVGGAGIGVVSGLAVSRYHRTRPGTRLDRWLLGASVRTGGGMVVAPLLVVR